MTKILTESGIKKLWTKIKEGFLSLSGGTVNDTFSVVGNKISFKTATDSLSDNVGVNVHGALYVNGLLRNNGNTVFMKADGKSAKATIMDNLFNVNVPLKANKNVGIGGASPSTTRNLTVKTDAEIPTVYTNRIRPIDDENFIIGNDDNAGSIKVSTDMQGWDLDGYEADSMSEPDSNWSINTGGGATFATLTITNKLYVKVQSGSTTTRYVFDFAKALQLGLFVKG